MATAGALVGDARWTTGRPIFPRDDARFRRSAPALSAEARAASASLAAAADISLLVKRASSDSTADLCLSLACLEVMTREAMVLAFHDTSGTRISNREVDFHRS
jgi:hypothetical protein